MRSLSSRQSLLFGWLNILRHYFPLVPRPLPVLLDSFVYFKFIGALVLLILVATFYFLRRPQATTFTVSSNVTSIASANVILLMVNLFGGFEYWKSALFFIAEEGFTFEACSLHSSYFAPWVFIFILSKVGGDVVNLFLRLAKSASPATRPTFAYIFPRVTNVIICYLAWAFRVEFIGIFAGLTYIDDAILYLYYVLSVRINIYTYSSIVAIVQWAHTIKQVLVILLLLHNIARCNTNPFVIELSLVIVIAQLGVNLYNTYTTGAANVQNKLRKAN